jgi:hypothetical protein
MRGKISPAPGQPPRDAELMEVEEAKEQWSEYRLSDGSILRIKQVATEIWKIDDLYDQEGNPQYVVKSAGILNVIAPEKLKKRLN